MTTRKLEVIGREGRREFVVPHKDKSLRFVGPIMDGSYGKIIKQVNFLGLRIPTLSEAISLIYGASFKRDNWNDEVYCNSQTEDIFNVHKILNMPSRGIISSTKIFYTNEGVNFSENGETRTLPYERAIFHGDYLDGKLALKFLVGSDQMINLGLINHNTGSKHKELEFRDFCELRAEVMSNPEKERCLVLGSQKGAFYIDSFDTKKDYVEQGLTMGILDN